VSILTGARADPPINANHSPIHNLGALSTNRTLPSSLSTRTLILLPPTLHVPKSATSKSRANRVRRLTRTAQAAHSSRRAADGAVDDLVAAVKGRGIAGRVVAAVRVFVGGRGSWGDDGRAGGDCNVCGDDDDEWFGGAEWAGSAFTRSVSCGEEGAIGRLTPWLPLRRG